MLPGLLTKPVERGVSFEAFFRDYEGRFVELVDGEVFELSVTEEHQRILQFLITMMGQFVQVRSLGRIFYEPFALRLPEGSRVRSPDLMFLSTEGSTRVRGSYVEAPVDLVVEVVSPESQHRDRTEKLIEYAGAGIPEYWIIDPSIQTVDLLRLGEDSSYRLLVVNGEGRIESSAIQGFWLKTDWLWAEEPPSAVEVFRAWSML